MSRLAPAIVAVLAAAGCGPRDASPPAPVHDAPASDPGAQDSASAAGPASVAPGGGAATCPASATGDPSVAAAPGEAATPADAPTPAVPVKKSATWPFAVWDRAEAFTFNHVAYGPGIPLRVYDAAHGWSPRIAERKPITAEQGARAVAWVIATRGEIEVSKCAFPRHAVVLYAGETPVGSANVCFECGDILVWPDFEAPPDWDHWTDAAARQHARKLKKQLGGYKKVFPQWERLFRDELGFSLAPPRAP